MPVQTADHSKRGKTAAYNFYFERTLIRRIGFSRRKFLFFFIYFKTIFDNKFHPVSSPFFGLLYIIWGKKFITAGMSTFPDLILDHRVRSGNNPFKRLWFFQKMDSYDQNLLTNGNMEESHIFQLQYILKHYWCCAKLFFQYQSFYFDKIK